MIHNYNKDIVTSELNPVPDSIYGRMFPNLQSIQTIPRNDVLQVKGRMDKIITLENGKVYRFEEKCRYKNYGDLLIEEKSAMEYNTDGWILKPSQATYMLYYIHSTGQGYVYHLKQLQDEWAQRGEFLKVIGTKCLSPNEGYNGNIYHTLNWAVPFRMVKSKCHKVSLN